MTTIPIAHFSLPAPAMFLGALVLAAAAGAAEPDASCDENPAYHSLDFWVGRWNVLSGDEVVGYNRIEKILDGCAILEHWTDVAGGQGKSLFYYAAAENAWKQVWVTSRATRVGGTKEKAQVPADDAGSIRFRGEIPAEGGSYLDRTTLTPLADGRVRQHIEISTDGGQNWRTTFDAVYVRDPR